MKVLTVVGARPQFIKAAVVSRVLRDRVGVKEVIVHTGQHYDKNMSEIFFEELNIPEPDYNLGVGGGSHGEMTGRQLEAIEKVLMDERPDWVLVYGDTNSTLAGTLAAVKLNIRVAHVEAGLRSFNRRMPEEINRILTDHASTLLFAPTSTSLENLRGEGVASELVHLVGDVMFDASLYYRKLGRMPEALKGYLVQSTPFVLATIHRAENTDSPDKLNEIIKGFGLSGNLVIMPLHPRTRLRLKESRIAVPDNLVIVDPVGYLEMVWLEENCRLVATDSGGVQKEAYFFRKPCVTLREETEWVELVSSGWNTLVGTCAERVGKVLASGFVCPEYTMFYGDGTAGENIVRVLLES